MVGNFFLGAYLTLFLSTRYPSLESQCLVIAAIAGIVCSFLPLGFSIAFKMDPYSSVWLSRLFMVGLFLLFLAISYITWRPFFYVRKNIQKFTSRQNYLPLVQDYGRNVSEIKRVMHIETLNLSPTGDNDITTLRDMWHRIMSDDSHSIIRKICLEIFDDLPGSLVECYDLVWLMSICDNPHRSRLSKIQLRTIARASTNQLRNLLSNSSLSMEDQHFDRVDIIFALISGYFNERKTPRDDKRGRYRELFEYSPSLIYNLAFGEGGLIDDENAVYRDEGPYTFLSNKEQTALEKTLNDITDANVDEYVRRWGLVGLDKLDRKEKVRRARSELSMYEDVFNRDSDEVPPFPDLTGLNRHDAEKALLIFTNRELIDHYEPRQTYETRKELLQVIYDDVNGDPRWSLCSLLFCQNDDTINVISAELHGEQNKYNADDPTLSYGTSKSYRCYQASELLQMFNDFDGIFLFRVPDWLPGTNEMREFPVESIKQLQRLLASTRRYGTLRQLASRIEEGLNTMKDARQRVHTLEQEIFSDEEREIIELYCVWLFTCGMWMRFWKGPGNPWPVRNAGYELSAEQRDAHVIIQDMVRSRIVERYENNPRLKAWIEDLPVIYIDLTSNEPATCATHSVLSIIEKINEGNYCMGFGSDTILKTGYFFISELLHHPEGKNFNDFLNTQLPRLLEIESSVLDTIGNSNASLHQAAMVRREQIRRGFVSQPGFTSHDFRNNRHVA